MHTNRKNNLKISILWNERTFLNFQVNRKNCTNNYSLQSTFFYIHRNVFFFLKPGNIFINILVIQCVWLTHNEQSIIYLNNKYLKWHMRKYVHKQIRIDSRIDNFFLTTGLHRSTNLIRKKYWKELLFVTVH